MIFSVCPPPPPPPQYVMLPQLQSTCHYIVKYYVKIWHVRLGGGGGGSANIMHPLSLGAQTEKIRKNQEGIDLIIEVVLVLHISEKEITISLNLQSG